MKTRLESILSILFGGIFGLLVIVITIETIVRKVFNVSLQGADELGGYALAVGTTLAFSLAVFGRNHIRVDVCPVEVDASCGTASDTAHGCAANG